MRISDWNTVVIYVADISCFGIEESNIFCECVCDGIHVHPAMIKLLYKNVGKERFVTISDSIRPAGLPNGNYDSGGQSVMVEDGLAYLDKGNSEN